MSVSLRGERNPHAAPAALPVHASMVSGGGRRPPRGRGVARSRRARGLRRDEAALRLRQWLGPLCLLLRARRDLQAAARLRGRRAIAQRARVRLSACARAFLRSRLQPVEHLAPRARSAIVGQRLMPVVAAFSRCGCARSLTIGALPSSLDSGERHCKKIIVPIAMMTAVASAMIVVRRPRRCCGRC